MVKKESKRTLYVIRRNEGKCQKWVASFDGKQKMSSVLCESEYEVNDFGCSCPGYKYRKSCRHMDLWADPSGGAVLVSREEGGDVARAARKMLGKENTSVQRIDEVGGMVRAVHLLTNCKDFRSTTSAVLRLPGGNPVQVFIRNVRDEPAV